MIPAFLVLAAAVAAREALRRWRAQAVLRRLPSTAPTPSRFPSAFGLRLLVAADVDAAIVRRAVPVVLAATAAAVLVGGLPLGVVVFVFSAVTPLLWLWLHRDRRDRRIEQLLPDALESIARALRSGGSLQQALEITAASLPPPLRSDFDRLVVEVRHGGGVVTALDRWAEQRSQASVRLAVAALALGAETGGAQARAVDGVAATLRQRLAMAAELRALSSQARTSAIVIAAAPLGFGLFASLTDGRTASFLLRSPLGLACLAAGLFLDAVAAVWMHTLTRPPHQA